ncbi:hypothetical protein P154DRAFT_566163 [Amniculicola lignicola CBS 123094]|uniref:Uncharacterized protein n=1 Tax=Amniculicola lignicola CBS 123094 TaxID=1392246 RepID=A0A6A5W835_9PLEO|nr:hypothetical protein P154DRAFT_566163 [Amniculicola lignicola CBS 123094]
MADAPLRIAENITLLQKVCNKPIPPTRNELLAESNDSGRTLSLEQELEITECLTFLSAYSDDPGKVMAMYIEETNDPEGLLVSVATNSGSDRRLKEGLIDLVKLLEREAKRPGHEDGDNVLGFVLNHGRERLISRLGFNGSSTSNQPLGTSTPGLLREALRQYQKHVVSAEKILYRLSDELYSLTTQFAKAGAQPSSPLLIPILKVAAEICTTHSEGLSSILMQLQNQWMDPNTKEKLSFRLAQLGKYVPSVNRLLKLARRIPLFRSISLRTVYLAPIRLGFGPSPQDGVSGGLLQQHIQTARRYRSPRITSAIQRLSSRHQKNLQAWQQEIRRAVTKRDQNGGYRVHAEIQLILDCECRNDILHPPRIIKSSKSACYLCDLFIKLHCRFFIPKTHGRLSGEGRTRMDHIVNRFNERIEDLLVDVAARDWLIKNDPRESDVFSLSPSTVASVPNLAELITGEVFHPDINNSTETVRPTTPKINSSSGNSVNGQEVVWSEPTQTDRPFDTDACVSPITPTSPTIPRSLEPVEVENPPKHTSPLLYPEMAFAKMTPASVPINLQRGIPYSHIFRPNTTPVRFHIQSIHIELSRGQADHIASCSSINLPRHNCQEAKTVQVEAMWLDSAEVQNLSRASISVVDLGSRWRQKDTEENVLFEDDGLMIMKGRDIVRLKGSYIVA